MKTIETNGITFIKPVPDGTSEWYYGISYEHGDLYEAEEIFKNGGAVKGRDLCLIRYPEGEIFRPVARRAGSYMAEPVYFENGIFILDVHFPEGILEILRFDCDTHETEQIMEMPLLEVRDCYNLQLHTSPVSLTRQGGADGLFEILWPERICFTLGEHESFFLREGEKLYFNKWFENGSGPDYRYWEETVVRNLQGVIVETLPGDFQIMPNGEMWYIK